MMETKKKRGFATCETPRERRGRLALFRVADREDPSGSLLRSHFMIDGQRRVEMVLVHVLQMIFRNLKIECIDQEFRGHGARLVADEVIDRIEEAVRRREGIVIQGLIQKGGTESPGTRLLQVAEDGIIDEVMRFVDIQAASPQSVRGL